MSSMADRVDLQKASESVSELMRRWKFGVVFSSFGGRWSISPFSSCRVVFEGALKAAAEGFGELGV